MRSFFYNTYDVILDCNFQKIQQHVELHHILKTSNKPKIKVFEQFKLKKYYKYYFLFIISNVIKAYLLTLIKAFKILISKSKKLYISNNFVN